MRKFRTLWNYFLKNEADDFERERKLTVKEIRRIGVKKFVAANGWETTEDVSKWRTDILEVIPCPHCNKDFGILDENMGLCDSCLPKFDLKRFYNDVYQAAGSDTAKLGKSLILFMFNKGLREKYLKEENKGTTDTSVNN